MSLSYVVGLIIVGAIIGILARLAIPGRQSISVVVTVILGILGALVGGWVADALDVGTVLRWIIGIAVAALLIVGYGAATGRRRV
jgi:uncharacterized membrane protein YeaQ/YmgE (transglycosylase-associated protein family)